VHLVHCLDARAAADLLERERPASELIYLDLPLGDADGAEAAAALSELARGFVAHGTRRVLAPLARFRNEDERQGFRTAFYRQLLAGDSAGEALRRAQQSTRDRFGAESGWWLYRIFGQTDEALIPAASRDRSSGGKMLGV
jgi:hypothetical protein